MNAAKMLAAALVSSAALVAACGSDDPERSPDGSGATSSGAGGTTANGGNTGVGGNGVGGGGDGGSDPQAFATISNWLDTCLPWGNPTEPQRTPIINAIIDACAQFGPSPSTNPGWQQQYCWAHLTGAILAESSYTVDAIAEPGSDPTVGLLQIRFSSDVCEFYRGGARPRLEAMGCTFPAEFADHVNEDCGSAFWSSTGGDAAHTQWMETIPCNVGLGAWAYYIFATGGGNTSTTNYVYQICNGEAVGANLVAGLLSHLMGPSSNWAGISDMASVPASGADYVTNIKEIMDCALGTVSGTHPLFLPLTPNPVQYCP